MSGLCQLKAFLLFCAFCAIIFFNNYIFCPLLWYKRNKEIKHFSHQPIIDYFLKQHILCVIPYYITAFIYTFKSFLAKTLLHRQLKLNIKHGEHISISFLPSHFACQHSLPYHRTSVPWGRLNNYTSKEVGSLIFNGQWK